MDDITKLLEELVDNVSAIRVTDPMRARLILTKYLRHTDKAAQISRMQVEGMGAKVKRIKLFDEV